MNTRKQVLIMSALLLMMLIAIGIYAAWYPGRATDAEAHFQEQTSERGSRSLRDGTTRWRGPR